MKLKLFTKFSTLNNNCITLLKSKFIKYKEKKNNRIIKYLSKYIYAMNNTLDIEHSNKYNNPIWQLWLQGKDKMPPIVKFCTNSILKNNSNRQIIFVTEENLNEYIDIPDYIIEKYKKGKISHIHFSDLIRLFLLCKYGGTWIDSTVYMTGSMPQYILDSDFFVPKDLTASLINANTSLEDFVILNNKMNFGAFTNSISFIHTKLGNEILEDALKVMLEYWKYENSAIDYLFFSYILTIVIFSKQTYKEKFISAPYKLTTVEYGLLQQCLYEHFNKKLFEQIKSITPIHKLIYKNQDRNIFKDTFLNYFLKNMSD